MKSLLKNEVRQRYDAFAPNYDRTEGILEFLGMRRLRRRLLEEAFGEVLEVGVGTGNNLPLYPRSCRVTAVDLSEGMLHIARKRALAARRQVRFLVMDGESLGFANGSFDTVVDSLTLCTFNYPTVAIGEMSRVCRPTGHILLLEHGRSRNNWRGRFQDWRAENHARSLGCVWNREPLELVQEAGLAVVASHRSFFGVVHSVLAKPGRNA